MATEEEGYFLRVNCLINNVGKNLLHERINHHCQGNGLSFKSFLSQPYIQHLAFHLWRPQSCCQCKYFVRKYIQVFQEKQFKLLYRQCGKADFRHSVDEQDRCACPYRVNENVDVACLDITMATALLLNLDMVSDIEVKSVKRLRDYRNTFQHKPDTSLDSAEFERWWQKICICLRELMMSLPELVQKNIDAEIQRTYVDTLDARLFRQECSTKDLLISKAKENITQLEMSTMVLKNVADDLKTRCYSGYLLPPSTEEEEDMDGEMLYPIVPTLPSTTRGCSDIQAVLSAVDKNTIETTEKTKGENDGDDSRADNATVQHPFCSSKMFEYRDRRLKITLFLLSNEIDEGRFDRVEHFVLTVIKRNPPGEDVIPGIAGFHACVLLRRGEFKKAEKVIHWAMRKCNKSSDPLYFTFLLHTLLTRIQYSKNDVIALKYLLEEEEQMIESDKVYLGGVSAGWYYAKKGLFLFKQLSVLRRNAQHCHATINSLYESCVRNFELAIENFQIDTASGNGPRFVCIAATYLVILILRCGIDGKEMNTKGPCLDDVEKARKYLDNIEFSNVRLVRVDKIYFLFAKCDYFFRCNVPVRALQYAEDALELAKVLKWKLLEDAAENRRKYLSMCCFSDTAQGVKRVLSLT